MDLIVTLDGTARFGTQSYRCALGRGGVRSEKCEGDGASPAGRYRFVTTFFRPDRTAEPRTALPTVALTKADGWCDDPAHPDYNHKVALPHSARCETMWRGDGLYDVVVTTDHNSDPVVPGTGSAIFVHVAGGPDYPPTEGCIAFSIEDLRDILSRWTDQSRLVIEPGA